MQSFYMMWLEISRAFLFAIAYAVVFLCSILKERKGKRMEREKKNEKHITELLCKLTEAPLEVPIYTKIMMAGTVQELVDLHLNLNDVLQLFPLVEKMGAADETERNFPDCFSSVLEKVPSVKRGRRLFI